MKARKRGVLAAICVMASLGVGAGQLADGAMHQVNAARKHLAGVKYEDIPSTKPTKSATGAASVFDDDLLAPHLRQSIGKDASNRVRTAAGR